MAFWVEDTDAAIISSKPLAAFGIYSDALNTIVPQAAVCHAVNRPAAIGMEDVSAAVKCPEPPIAIVVYGDTGRSAS